MDAGTYIILSAKSISKAMAIDVSANSDTKGANVQLWSKNGKSGQYISVTGSSPKQILRFPLTGKVVDVYCNTAKNGQNIIQWVGNGNLGQAWNIVATGSNVTITGVGTYPTYYIKSALNNNLVLGLKNSATSDGTNVQLMTYSSSNAAQKWVFLSVGLLPKGNYRFISALDTKVCLASVDRGDGQNIQAAGIDLENNRQAWLVSGGTANTNIMNHFSQCYMNADGTSVGSKVTQKAKINGQRTSWLLTTSGSMKYNGATYPLVTLISEAGQGAGSEICVDVGADSDKMQTNAQLYNNHSRKGQKYIALPAPPVNQEFTAPSSPRMAYSKGGTAYVNIWGKGKTTAYPCWISQYKQFQFRYRHRVRKVTAADDERSAWSAWQFYGNDTSNDGWGDVSKANATPTALKDPNGQTRLYNTAHTYTLSTTGNDLVEYQFQVRPIVNQGSISARRGAIATVTGKYIYTPTCTVSVLSWAPNGVSITYASDQPRNNNDMVIFSVTCVHGNKTYTVYDGGTDGYPISDIPYFGTALLPQKKVRFVPYNHDMVTVKFRFTNVDGAYSSKLQTVTMECIYGQGAGLSIEPTMEITSGKMLHVRDNVQDATKHTLWIDYEDNRSGFIQYNDSDGEWYIPVLFNRSYRVWVMVEKGSRWDTWTGTWNSVDSDAYFFNFVNASTGAQDWFQILVNADQTPRFTRSIAYDNDIQTTNGNSLEVVHFGTARKEGLQVGGILPFTFTIPSSNVSKVEALVNAHYAWLRAPKVDTAWRVAIESCSLDYAEMDYIQVSLSMRRINNPADW